MSRRPDFACQVHLDSCQILMSADLRLTSEKSLHSSTEISVWLTLQAMGLMLGDIFRILPTPVRLETWQGPCQPGPRRLWWEFQDVVLIGWELLEDFDLGKDHAGCCGDGGAGKVLPASWREMLVACARMELLLNAVVSQVHHSVPCPRVFPHASPIAWTFLITTYLTASPSESLPALKP